MCGVVFFANFLLFSLSFSPFPFPFPSLSFSILLHNTQMHDCNIRISLPLSIYCHIAMNEVTRISSVHSNGIICACPFFYYHHYLNFLRVSYNKKCVSIRTTWPNFCLIYTNRTTFEQKKLEFSQWNDAASNLSLFRK